MAFVTHAFAFIVRMFIPVLSCVCVLSSVCFHVCALICVLSHVCSQTCVLRMCAFMCPISYVCFHMCSLPCVLGDLCLLIFCTSTLFGVS